MKEIVNKCRLTLTIALPNETDSTPQQPTICPLCNEHFATKFKFTQHLKINTDCFLQNQVGKFTPLKCPNPGCNECYVNKNDLGKTPNVSLPFNQ